MANSVDPDQTAPIGVVCSGSMLFASILVKFYKVVLKILNGNEIMTAGRTDGMTDNPNPI